MTGHGRRVSAVVTALVWGVVAAVVAFAVAVWLTDRPATTAEPGGEVIHLKSSQGPEWSAAVAAGCVVGVAAGFAGAAWSYNKPS